MAVTNTHTDTVNMGSIRIAYGTFTSANGDNTVTLTSGTDHGLNVILMHQIELDGHGVPIPDVSISGGTVTATFNDTLGYSGRWTLIGR